MGTNRLCYGDNLDVLRRHVADSSVDLIYLDPPFQSGKNYNVFFRSEKGTVADAQVRAFKDTWHWGPEAEASFDDVTQAGGAPAETMVALRTILGECDLLAYLSMMAPRLIELRRVLKPTGSLYLHCDQRASHYLKVVLDGVFGPECFRNEIVWRYRRWSAVSYRFQRMHDVLLFYTRSGGKTHTFHKLYGYEELSESTKKRFGDKKQHADFSTGHRKPGVEDGELAEVELPDVWDLGVIAPQAKERLGYPTQKPEALLERVIKASSNVGDVILDPFCGCGTAVAVAERLQRGWIGIDITHLAIGLIKYRMQTAFKGSSRFEVIGEPVSIADARQLAKENPYQFQWWFVGRLTGRPVEKNKGKDRGVDGRIYFRDEPEGGPKQIILSVKAGRSEPRDIRDLRGVVERESMNGAVMGALLTLTDPTPEMVREAASAGFYHSPYGGRFAKLQLLTADQMLAGQSLKYPAPGQTNVSLRKAPAARTPADQQALPGIASSARRAGGRKRAKRA